MKLLTKVRFVAREVPFRRPRSAVSSPAKCRFVARESTFYSRRTYSRFERVVNVKFFCNNIPLQLSILKDLCVSHCIALQRHTSLVEERHTSLVEERHTLVVRETLCLNLPTFHFLLFTLKSSSHRTIMGSNPDAQRAEPWEDAHRHPPIILPFSLFILLLF